MKILSIKGLFEMRPHSLYELVREKNSLSEYSFHHREHPRKHHLCIIKTSVVFGYSSKNLSKVQVCTADREYLQKLCGECNGYETEKFGS